MAGTNTTASASSASATFKAPAAPAVDPAALVYHVNLFIIALISALVLLRFRRTFARFYSFNEITSGLFLRHVKTYPTASFAAVQRNPSTRTVATTASAYSTDKFGTEESHSYSLQSPMSPNVGLTRPLNSTPLHYPPHIPSCPRFFRPLFLPLRNRLASGYSVSQLLIQLLWFSCLVFAAFFKTDPFTDPTRLGWIGVSQLPFILLFSAKNSPLAMLLGTGYDKLNFMHRFLGRVVFLTLNLHAIDFWYKWQLSGTVNMYIKTQHNIYGLIALIGVDFLFLFSTSSLRNRAYHFFLATHAIGYGLLLAGVWFHSVVARPYLYACFGIMALDRLLRVLKTRVVKARIRPIPELGITRVECKSLNSGWRAGQHVRVRVVTSGMGLLGWLWEHPFSIASTAVASGGKEGEGLTLMVKKSKEASSWTNRLFDLARRSGGGVDREKGIMDIGKDITLVVEGPYGGPGPSMYASYSAVVLVLGGSGISYGLSVIKELVQKDLLGQSRVKVIEVAWMVQDPAALIPLIPMILSLIRQSSPSTNHLSSTSLKINVFYTRAPTGQYPFPDDYFAPYYPKLTLSPGRPKIGSMIEGVMNRIVRLGSGVKDNEQNMGVAVGVCGPGELGDDVTRDVGNLDEDRRDRCGGVEVIEEVFGW